ncbi:iron-sulfur cluster assembly accessory protein [Rhodobacter viridis]|uniref:Iron-sulfur cluster assembly accessory protein n=1 Tax=Rhodobacter viridis TaxID=1054202 RepID=A0A318TRF1_9RHOB|nr:iron-sulfur cluster assembly accessory protein [Rhodobacter viridis]PYF07174.1 iron-sulfur cluster assembly accessory protein [Rhodobacter viridis]
MIEITQPAKDAIRSAIAKAGQPVAGLRLLVETGGRAGPSYGMLVERKADPADETLTFGDVTLLIDPETRPHLAGTKVDFVASVAGARFVFEKSFC